MSGIDPPSNDIDSVNGYLRDARFHSLEQQTLAAMLRLKLDASDKQNAAESDFIKIIPKPTKDPGKKGMRPQFEHVLEVSVMSHMLDNQRFKNLAREKLGQHYLSTNNFTPIETLAFHGRYDEVPRKFG